jgi:arylsulfatase A-like enzyme
MKWILFFCLISSYAVAQNNRPNILVIFSDDHTQQTISAYGSRLMQTPAIDRIASEGAILRNSFVTNSLCAPSRAVFLTGKYGHMNGLIDNSPGRRFDGSQQQLQKILGANGYQTAWIGKWHLQTLPQGFDFWRVLPDQGNYFQPDFINMNNDTIRYTGYVSNLISDFSLEWLRKRDTSKPFFLVVGEKATHREWFPDIRDLGSFDDEEFPLPRNFFDNYEGRDAASKQDMTIDKR